MNDVDNSDSLHLGSEADQVTSPQPSERANTRAPLWALLLSFVVLTIDQVTKQWAYNSLQGGAVRSVIGDTLEFRLAFNEGSAFSLFGGGGFTAVLAVVATIVSILLVRMLRTSKDRMTTIGLALVLGGALGNLTDRIFRAPGVFRGHVIDFIAVRHIPLIDRWPVFNVADMGIVCGVLLLLLVSFRSDRQQASNRD